MPINNKKKLDSKNPINYIETVLLLIKSFVVSVVIIIIGTSFIFTTKKDAAYMNIKYPSEMDMYTEFPFVDAGHATRGALGNFLNDLPFDTWNPYSPAYSKWFSQLFLDTYVLNRTLLKSIIHSFHSDKQHFMPDSCLFIIGCLEFILITMFFMPSSFFINYFLSLTVYKLPFIMGGFIMALPIAAYNSFYLYCSYAYNSTLGPILENSKEFIASGKNVHWAFILIFLGFFVLNSDTCVNSDISYIILIMYSILIFVSVVHQLKLWFISNKT